MVLALFEVSYLGRRISEIVNFFLQKNSDYEKPFVAILINALCHNHVDWNRISNWLDIDQAAFKTTVLNSPVSKLVGNTSNWYEFSSPELAAFILKHFDVDPEIVINVYTKIVRETAYSANDPRSGFDARENLKELMRFRFLTNLFSESANGTSTISAVYHRLSNTPRIRKNDQFWLQYAMARMESGDLDNAETFLNTAIGIAKTKGEGYSKRQITDQRIRLIFKKNSRLRARFREKEIISAFDDLIVLLNERGEYVVHPLRSSKDMLELLELKIDDFSPDSIKHMLSVVELMLSKIPANGKLDKSRKGETQVIANNLKNCRLILQNM